MRVQGRDTGLRTTSDSAICRVPVPLAVLDARVIDVDPDARWHLDGAAVYENVEVDMDMEKQCFLGLRLQSCVHRELQRVAGCPPDQRGRFRGGLSLPGADPARCQHGGQEAHEQNRELPSKLAHRRRLWDVPALALAFCSSRI